VTTRRETLAAVVTCVLRQMVAPFVAAVVAPVVAPGEARADPSPAYTVRLLRLTVAETLFDSVVVVVPRNVGAGARLPLVVALHGLGESTSPALGAQAWPSLYGLLDAADRLLSPPVTPRGKRGDLTPAHAATLNRELAARPFGGVVVACPFTPNPAGALDRQAHLTKYATWVREVLVPRVREQYPVSTSEAATHLAGCSMGGSVALEVAQRSPGAFGGLALVQSAHGAHRNAPFAVAAATLGPAGGPLPTLVLTSQGDPFRERNVALGAELAKQGVPHEAVVLPGPHDQPWLREAGTPTMLHWLDRRPRS